MNIKIEVYLNGLRTKVKREIEVNDYLSLEMFSEYLIISMNGNCKHLYQLIKNEEYTYLGPYNSIRDYEYEMMMDDLTLSDLALDVGDILMLNYDFKSDWEFMIKIKQVKDGYYEKDFEVISGCGKGIVEDCFGVSNLKKLINPKMDEFEKSWCLRVFKNYQGYDINDFDIDVINNNIVGYQDLKKEIVRPKNYIMNVSLEGYGNEIKRKIAVDSNVYLDNFCKNIILSMNGTLDHCYGIKIGKEYLEEEIVKERDLNYLRLKEKQKFKIIYDYGDNWIFNVVVSKIVDGYGERKRFEVLKGKGYGIIEDCGGLGDLYEIFEGINTDYEGYDINEFDIVKINEIIDENF